MGSFWSDVETRRALVLCALLAGLQGMVLFGVQTTLSGFPALPLDDAYIHWQYAKQIAEGDYFRYQAGEPVSSGETSFLYVHLVALGYLVGFRDSLLIVWVYGWAWLSTTAVFFLAWRIGKRLSSNALGWAAVALIGSSGWLAWAFWSGMEIALFSALLLSAAYALLEPNVPANRFWLLLGCIALCRPEGAIFAVILFAMIGLGRIRNIAPYFDTSRFRFTLSLPATLLCVAGPPLFYRLTTSTFASNGLLAKSLFYNPIKTWNEQGLEMLDNVRAIGVFLLGFSPGSISWLGSHPGEFVLPFALIFAAVGLVALGWKPDPVRRVAALLLGIGVFVSLVSIATLEVWMLHSFRYLVPFIPLLYILALYGLENGFAGLCLHDRSVWISFAAAAVVLQLGHAPDWITRYAEQATTIAEKQIQAAEWMKRQLPLDSRVAINDAGALAYYSRQHLDDLVGLVTNGNTLAYRLGEGGVYERMEDLPPEQRPRYAAVFPSWFIEMARTYDVFHDPLVTFPDPFDPGYAKTVYRINWDYAGMEDRPRENTLPPGWGICDALDVADLRSEAEHDYTLALRGLRYPKVPVPLRRNFGYNEEVKAIWPNVEDAQPYLIPWLRRQGLLKFYDILDAGRRVDGSETFRLRHLQPGAPLKLVMRTCDDVGDTKRFTYRIGVFVNQRMVNEWTLEGSSWNWYEKVLDIPGDFIPESSVVIRVENRGVTGFLYYGSYYYWACQPNAPSHSLDNPNPPR